MSHAGKADKLLIKPTAGARDRRRRARPDDSLRRHERGLTPDESQTARSTPPWQRPLTDRPNDSHRRLSGISSELGGADGGVDFEDRCGQMKPRDDGVEQTPFLPARVIGCA